MKDLRPKLRFFQLKVRLSAKTIGWLLTQWRYAVLSLLVAVLFFELIYWSFNLGTLGFVLGSGNLNLGEKLRFVFDPLVSLGDTNGIYTAVLMLVLSIVQGISIAALIYTIRHQQKFDAAVVGGSSVAGLLAIVGLGCPACGTSLVTPIVALFVSGSTVAISESITVIALAAALLIGVYGLYAVGLKAATARVTAEQHTN